MALLTAGCSSISSTTRYGSAPSRSSSRKNGANRRSRFLPSMSATVVGGHRAAYASWACDRLFRVRKDTKTSAIASLAAARMRRIRRFISVSGIALSGVFFSVRRVEALRFTGDFWSVICGLSSMKWSKVKTVREFYGAGHRGLGLTTNTLAASNTSEPGAGASAAGALDKSFKRPPARK